MFISLSHPGQCRLTGYPEWFSSGGGPKQPVGSSAMTPLSSTCGLQRDLKVKGMSRVTEVFFFLVGGQVCLELAHTILLTFLV